MTDQLPYFSKFLLYWLQIQYQKFKLQEMNQLDSQTKDKIKLSLEQQTKNENERQNDEKDRRRKKKKKIHQKKHSPQYYEQLKLAKLNKKRQNQWNDRFIIESIPNEVPKHKRTFSSKKGSTKGIKHSQITKQTGNVYKIFHEQLQKKQKPSKSFNIRIVSKKQDRETASVVKKQQPNGKQQVKQVEKREQQYNSLIQYINKTHNENNFNDCHKDILIDIARKSKQKTILSYIHAQIARIKSITSIINHLEAALKRRDQVLYILQQNKQYENIEQYRLVTLKVIEQILQWREQMQRVYREQTNTKPKVVFTHKGENYLLKLGKQKQLQGMTKQQGQNPFLIGYEDKVIGNELLVKIRACQMLLIQEQLSES